MLEYFSVENYKSFKEKIEINFKNVHDYKFNNQYIKNGLLNKIVIYGPNSSGKSNLGFALFDIVGLLTDKNTNLLQNNELTFLNADSSLECATFKYVFRNKKDIICFIYKKNGPRKLTYEELFINDKKIYSYDFTNKKMEISNMNVVYAENLNFDYFENNLSILRYIAYNTNQPDDSNIKFIMNFVSHMLYFRSLQENDYIGLTTGKESLSEWIINNNLSIEFERFLHKMANINIKLDVVEFDNPTPIKLLVERHENKSFPFELTASSGEKTLELLFYWSKKFEDVKFLFMDEFDAFYHYDLAKNVLKYVLEMDNFQTIFTTHNPNLASSDILRPDCYFYLMNAKLTSFVDSTERELREGHSLEKLLRNGEFNE